MALAQILGDVQKPAQSYDEQLVAYTPPAIEDIQEDIQEDEPEPEPMDAIEKEPPELSLDQLDVALNPGTGGNLASSDLSVPDFSVGAQALSMNFINFRDLDNKPRPTRQITPVYPPALKSQGIEGRVFIRFDIDKQGNVVDATAKESDHPRGYEVAGNLIKQVAEVTEKLGDLQEKMRKLKEVPNTAPKNVTNALFVGSTAELQKMLKGK